MEIPRNLRKGDGVIPVNDAAMAIINEFALFADFTHGRKHFP